jgi:hypothetical protein
MQLRAIVTLVVLSAFRAEPVAAQSPPSVDSLLARAEAALGGRKALDAHTALRITGTVEFAGADLRGRIEILRAKPDKFVQKITLQDGDEIIKGYDGSIAWEIDPSGPGILTDSDAELVRTYADWYHDFTVPQAARGGRVDSTDFEGQVAWRLTYALSLGIEVHVFFDRETGLRLGEELATQKTRSLTMQYEYKTFGGAKFATYIVNRAPAGEMIMKIENVQFDAVNPSALALPPAIKALARK